MAETPPPSAGAGDLAPADLPRRRFVKGAFAVVGAAVAVEALGFVDLSRWTGLPPQALAQGVIFPDPTLCIGCLTCEVICSRVHKEQGLSDLPRIRIFDEPAGQVAPALQR